MNNLFRNYYIGSHKDYVSDISPLIHCIGLQGNDLVGLELGVSKSDSFMTILDNCPNIATLYGVDNYQPFFNEHTGQYITEFEVEMIKAESFNKHKFSEHSNKIKFLQVTSEQAAAQIPDESLDFIFIDADHSYDAVVCDLQMWYPKIKTGGLVAGHDYHTQPVSMAVNSFRSVSNISANMSTYLSCYVWRK